jgi:hypothetical protein
LPAKSRPTQQSSDDMKSLAELDAAETRARMALQLLEQEQERSSKLEHELEIAKMQRELDVARAAAARPVTVEMDAPSMPPKGGLVLRGRGFKVAVPAAALSVLGSLLLGFGNDYLNTRRKVHDLMAIEMGRQGRDEAREKREAELRKEIDELKVTQSQQAGFLVGAFPLAGVQVRGAEGTTQMDVKTAPLPPGEKPVKPKRMVTVTTPVPAPPK